MPMKPLKLSKKMSIPSILQVPRNDKTLVPSLFQLNFTFLLSDSSSFAEDHHGGIGGCIWPPRSYSCSFCKRKFRSAQALGGHMNVHRKDRARLNQSSSSTLDHHQHHYKTSDHVCVRPNDDHVNLKSLDSHHHQHHPNSSSSSVVAPTLSSPTSRVSVTSTTLIFSSYLEKQQKSSDVSSISNPVVVKNPREEASAICLNNKNDGKLVGSNNLFNSTRAKTEIFTLSFLSKPCSNDRCGSLWEVPGLRSTSLEEIDLKLRIGQLSKGIEDYPKIFSSNRIGNKRN